ncbi:MAG TPA: phosphodiester glycosidase family protein, partial [Saprospiraceae bacterium]|nr:phosphodiester glycosidase family protein [Saprospiraceae bacterium]
TSQGKLWDKNIRWENVIESGPLLIMKNMKMPLDYNPFNQNRHPRTCACITQDDILFFTIDGRTNEAYGLNLFELTDFLLAFDCIDAINFDGGGSTTMYIKDFGASGIVNMPCDNRLFDHMGERKVSNAIIIKESSKN